jgi:hypothetical protein
LVDFVHKRRVILSSTYDLAEVTEDAIIARLVPVMVMSETEELMPAVRSEGGQVRDFFIATRDGTGSEPGFSTGPQTNWTI